MKIEKLELKHLTPYSNCGLIWDFVGTQVTTLGIVGETLYTTDGGVLNWTKHPDYPTALTPILRPLRLLTEEIIHGGEKFVPIVELAKLNDEDFTDSIHVQTKCSESVFGVKYIDCAGLECVFAYRSSSIDFGLHTVSDKRFHQICNTFYLYQKLFEWHFDIHGLIDAGLAIDSTTVGNPYDK